MSISHSFTGSAAAPGAGRNVAMSAAAGRGLVVLIPELADVTDRGEGHGVEETGVDIG